MSTMCAPRKGQRFFGIQTWPKWLSQAGRHFLRESVPEKTKNSQTEEEAETSDDQQNIDECNNPPALIVTSASCATDNRAGASAME